MMKVGEDDGRDFPGGFPFKAHPRFRTPKKRDLLLGSVPMAPVRPGLFEALGVLGSAQVLGLELSEEELRNPKATPHPPGPRPPKPRG